MELFSTRMEEELKCPACRRLYTNPVTLPSCSHSVCLNCALRLQTPCPSGGLSAASLSAASLSSGGVRAARPDDVESIASSSYSSPGRPGDPDSGLGGSSMRIASPSDAGSELGYADSDGMSVVSETDSGVMCSGGGGGGGGGASTRRGGG